MSVNTLSNSELLFFLLLVSSISSLMMQMDRPFEMKPELSLLLVLPTALVHSSVPILNLVRWLAIFLVSLKGTLHSRGLATTVTSVTG